MHNINKMLVLFSTLSILSCNIFGEGQNIINQNTLKPTQPIAKKNSNPNFQTINNAEDLKNISIDGNYYITKSIDLKNKKWTPITFKKKIDSETPNKDETNKDETSEDETSEGFNGIIDGNGNTISGLSIISSNNNSIGLFSILGQEAQIKNLVIKSPKLEGKNYIGALTGKNEGIINNVAIINCEIVGSSHVGALAGSNENIIQNSYSTGSVSGKEAIGGLVGYNWKTIENSYSKTKVTGEQDTGGFVGYNEYSSERKINNSYSTGQVTGKNVTGGFLGNNNGNIYNCYSTSWVAGNNNTGGFLGTHNIGITNNCYFDKAKTKQDKANGNMADSGIVTYYTDIDNKLKVENKIKTEKVHTATTKENFSNWDFEKTWEYLGDGKWPILKWQNTQ